jgi:hypothetical protein
MTKKLLTMVVIDRLKTNKEWLKWIRAMHRKIIEAESVKVYTIGKHHYIRVSELNRYLSGVIPLSVRHVVDELVIAYNENYGEK